VDSNFIGGGTIQHQIHLRWISKGGAPENYREGFQCIRFILGGSVSVDRVVRKVTALSAINDSRRVILDGFDKETALLGSYIF